MRNWLFGKHTSVKYYIKNWYREQEPHHQILIVTTLTIVNPCIDSNAVKDISDILRIERNKKGMKSAANIPNMYH